MDGGSLAERAAATERAPRASSVRERPRTDRARVLDRVSVHDAVSGSPVARASARRERGGGTTGRSLPDRYAKICARSASKISRRPRRGPITCAQWNPERTRADRRTRVQTIPSFVIRTKDRRVRGGPRCSLFKRPTRPPLDSRAHDVCLRSSTCSSKRSPWVTIPSSSPVLSLAPLSAGPPPGARSAASREPRCPPSSLRARWRGVARPDAARARAARSSRRFSRRSSPAPGRARTEGSRASPRTGWRSTCSSPPGSWMSTCRRR